MLTSGSRRSNIAPFGSHRARWCAGAALAVLTQPIAVTEADEEAARAAGTIRVLDMRTSSAPGSRDAPTRPLCDAVPCAALAVLGDAGPSGGAVRSKDVSSLTLRILRLDGQLDDVWLCSAKPDDLHPHCAWPAPKPELACALSEEPEVAPVEGLWLTSPRHVPWSDQQWPQADEHSGRDDLIGDGEAAEPSCKPAELDSCPAFTARSSSSSKLVAAMSPDEWDELRAARRKLEALCGGVCEPNAGEGDASPPQIVAIDAAAKGEPHGAQTKPPEATDAWCQHDVKSSEHDTGAAVHLIGAYAWGEEVCASAALNRCCSGAELTSVDGSVENDAKEASPQLQIGAAHQAERALDNWRCSDTTTDVDEGARGTAADEPLQLLTARQDDSQALPPSRIPGPAPEPRCSVMNGAAPERL